MYPGDGNFLLSVVEYPDACVGVFTSTCARHFTRHIILTCRPTGGIATAVLFFFLHLNPHRTQTFKELIDDFDFVGLGLIIAGVICLLIGFNASETACKVLFSVIFF